MIRKWELKNRRLKRQGAAGGTSSKASDKQLRPDELKQILSRLPEKFGSAEIRNALIASGICDGNPQLGYEQFRNGRIDDLTQRNYLGLSRELGTDH